MPEGVKPYPRWDGPLTQGPLIGPIVGNEVRRAWRSMWTLLALALIGVYVLLSVGSLSDAGEEPSIDDYVVYLSRPSLDFLNAVQIEMTFAPLALAAIISGPSLLEDVRRGALELYMSRAVNRVDYLAGKITAVFGITTLSVFVPGMVYYVATFFFFDKFPAGWALIPLQTLAYAAMWGLLASALGLGLSAALRSSVGATLILFGVLLGLHAIVSNLIEGITEDPIWQILSPMSALQQLTEVVFPVEGPFKFPTWWAAVEWAGLVILGCALLIWRHPRVRGEDRGRP